MNKAQRIARANRKTAEAISRTTELKEQQLYAQKCLSAKLKDLVAEMKREHPGVWHSITLEDLENMAFQLDELTEAGYAPRVTLSWQMRFEDKPRPAVLYESTVDKFD